MIEQPAQPADALSAEELERFLHSCSRERRSPTTQRMIDAASYGWVYNFIHSEGRPDDDWLVPGDAYASQLAGFFSRVSHRLRGHPSSDYAASLADYFETIPD